MIARWIPGTAIALLLAGLAGCTGSRPTLPTQHYVPTNREMAALGPLQLSNTRLRFEALEGEMELEYAGIMPEAAGGDVAGASVYRVKNAEAYFEKNAGRQAFCSVQPRWVAVGSTTGAPAWSNEIWVGLLTLEDWAKFTHATDRVCAGGDYLRTGG